MLDESSMLQAGAVSDLHGIPSTPCGVFHGSLRLKPPVLARVFVVLLEVPRWSSHLPGTNMHAVIRMQLKPDDVLALDEENDKSKHNLSSAHYGPSQNVPRFH